MKSENLERLIALFKSEMCSPHTEPLIDAAEDELKELKEVVWMYEELCN